jgi:PadR family transcriptional regulator, regulatory protein AphA
MSGVLRHALLALIAEEPRSGYDLTRIFDRSLGHAWSASHSQIYPELARLRGAGLIEQLGAGARERKPYRVTDAGRAEVRRWLAQEPPGRTFRDETILRSFFLWLLDPAERRSFLNNERNYRAGVLGGFERLAVEGSFSGPVGLSGRIALEFGIRYERMFLEWLDWALEQIDELP